MYVVSEGLIPFRDRLGYQCVLVCLWFVWFVVQWDVRIRWGTTASVLALLVLARGYV